MGGRSADRESLCQRSRVVATTAPPRRPQRRSGGACPRRVFGNAHRSLNARVANACPLPTHFPKNGSQVFEALQPQLQARWGVSRGCRPVAVVVAVERSNRAVSIETDRNPTAAQTRARWTRTPKSALIGLSVRVARRSYEPRVAGSIPAPPMIDFLLTRLRFSSSGPRDLLHGQGPAQRISGAPSAVRNRMDPPATAPVAFWREAV
jgi:hypothetical protein